MTVNGWIQILLYCAVVAALVKPLGAYLTRVLDGDLPGLGADRAPALPPRRRRSARGAELARLRAGAARLQPRGRPRSSTRSQRLQGGLPLNPAGMAAVPPELAFNTAVSFVTNTNWQNYGGETTMSHLTQMAGLTVQNFVSAATGIAVAVAVIRGFARVSARSVGNFWVDLTRITLFVLLPICVVFALVLICLGHAADARRRGRGDDARRRAPDHRHRPGRLADRDQDARHQRRRLLQRQRRASVREPDRGRELPADGLDLRPRRGAHQRLRPHGRRRAPGLGDPRRDGRPLHRRRRRHLLGRGGRQPARPRARHRRRQHGGQGGPLRPGALGALRRHHHRRLLRRGQRHARQLHAARRA